jgi:hypothetical protein
MRLAFVIVVAAPTPLFAHAAKALAAVIRPLSSPWLKGRSLRRDWQQLETVTRRE